MRFRALSLFPTRELCYSCRPSLTIRASPENAKCFPAPLWRNPPMTSKKPAAAVTPIQHVVIITKENHTFDNYFGTFPGATGVPLPQAPDPVNDPRHDHTAWLNRNHKGGAVKLQYKQKDIPKYWSLA